VLIGESARIGDQAEIQRTLEAHPAVRRLIHMRTLHLGPDELLIGAKLELVPRLDFVAVARTLNEIEASLRERIPSARIIYLEPDVHSEAELPGQG